MILFKETTIEKFDLPERIYKYRKWSNPDHKRILSHNEIKFSSPLDCEEQHECNLPRDYDSITEEMLYNYYYLTAPDMGYVVESERIRIANHMKKNSPFHNQEKRIFIEEKFRRELNKQLSMSLFSVLTERLPLS